MPLRPVSDYVIDKQGNKLLGLPKHPSPAGAGTIGEGVDAVPWTSQESQSKADRCLTSTKLLLSIFRLLIRAERHGACVIRDVPKTKNIGVPLKVREIIFFNKR